MPIVRTYPHKNFTIVRNEVLRNPELSLKAKGLLAMMLSFPGDWDYVETHLLKLSTDGRDGTRSALKELVDQGYIRKEQTKDANGVWSTAVLHVSDELCTVAGKTVDGKTVDGESDTTNTDLTKTERPTKETFVGKADSHAGKSEELTREESFQNLVRELIEIWNRKCGNLAKTRTHGAEIEKLIRGLARRHGDNLRELFTTGIDSVKNDRYWLGNKVVGKIERDAPPYGLINYLRNMEQHVDRALEVKEALPEKNIRPGRVWYTDAGIVLVKTTQGDGYRVQVMRPLPDVDHQPGDELYLKPDAFRRERSQ